MKVNGTELARLQELHELAKEDARRYPRKRDAYTDIKLNAGRHFTAIVGPRGVGKTVLLRQMAGNESGAFYISLDTLQGDLFETAKSVIERYGVNLLLLDEVHFCADYGAVLKRIFDFLDTRVIFTSSVSLSIFDSAHDLSRRVKLVELYPFSFREYLYFNRDVRLPKLTLEAIVAREWTPDHLGYEHLFEKYLEGGLMPFSMEEKDVLPMLRNVVGRIIREDIPSVARLMVDELSVIEKVLEFIGRSDVDGMSYTSVGRNVGITKGKAEQYIGLLERAFILNPLFPAGTNVLREPKILMCLPFRQLYRDHDEALGAIREDFFVEAVRMAGLPCRYLKSTRGAKTPDFVIEHGGKEMVVEVGGKGKGREQFKGIEIKKRLIMSHSGDTDGRKRPLVLAGFL